MIEEDLRLYREKASHVASELEAFRRHYETAKIEDHKGNEKLKKELENIRFRIEKLESAVFSQ